MLHKCKSIIIATAQTCRLTTATNPNITTGGSKPSKDLKEDFNDVLEIIEAGSETHGDGPMKGRIIPETNDDKKGKVLYCQECNYQTPRLKQSKAKQKLKAHAFSWYKEDIPMDALGEVHAEVEDDTDDTTL